MNRRELLLGAAAVPLAATLPSGAMPDAVPQGVFEFVPRQAFYFEPLYPDGFMSPTSVNAAMRASLIQEALLVAEEFCPSWPPEPPAR